MHGTTNVKIIATTDGPVRLFNLTRRNWIWSLKIAQVRVVVEVGCYQTEARHVVAKDSRWEKDGKHNFSFRIVYTVDTYRMITLVASLILRKRSEDAQPFKNSLTTSLPPNGLWPTPLNFHLYPNQATSINPFFISVSCNSPWYTKYKTNYFDQCIVLKSFTLLKPSTHIKINFKDYSNMFRSHWTINREHVVPIPKLPQKGLLIAEQQLYAHNPLYDYIHKTKFLPRNQPAVPSLTAQDTQRQWNMDIT
jgi:hypothetical protein